MTEHEHNRFLNLRADDRDDSPWPAGAFLLPLCAVGVAMWLGIFRLIGVI